MAPSAKPMTKSEIQATLAEKCDLSKKQIDQVFGELGALIGENLANAPIPTPANPAADMTPKAPPTAIPTMP